MFFHFRYHLMYAISLHSTFYIGLFERRVTTRPSSVPSRLTLISSCIVKFSYKFQSHYQTEFRYSISDKNGCWSMSEDTSLLIGTNFGVKGWVDLPSDWTAPFLEYMDGPSYVAFVGTCMTFRKYVTNPSIKLNTAVAYARAMFALSEGHNVFLNGIGGCGKSHLMNRLKEATAARLHKKMELTAPTGLAASSLTDGCTIHSASGLGQGTIPMDKLLIKIEDAGLGAKVTKKWTDRDILGVDEVGMCGRKFMEKCDVVARHTRDCDKPMGGVQVVVGGDFLQLPPVGDQFFMTSPLWDKLNFVIIDLLYSHRQQADKSYANMLSRIRVGEYTKNDVEVLEERFKISKRMDWDKEVIKPMHLFPHAADAQKRNQIEFGKLEDAEQEEDIVETKVILGDHGNMHDPTDAAAEDLSQEPEEPEVDWVADDSVCEYISIVDPISKRSNKQLHDTTRISYSEAINKMGSRIDQKVPILLQFKKGAQYILTFNYDLLNNKNNGSQCTYIGRDTLKFLDGSTLSRSRLMTSIVMPIPSAQNLYIKRRQLGLRLAYAGTYHGVQGMTLERAEMNLGRKVFAASTAYVGLSRLKNLNSLYLSDFDESSLKVSKVAKKFYDDLAKERKHNSDYNPMFMYIPPPYDTKSGRSGGLFNFFHQASPTKVLFVDGKRKRTNNNVLDAWGAGGVSTADDTTKKSRNKYAQASSSVVTSTYDQFMSQIQATISSHHANQVQSNPPTQTGVTTSVQSIVIIDESTPMEIDGSGSANDPYCL